MTLASGRPGRPIRRAGLLLVAVAVVAASCGAAAGVASAVSAVSASTGNVAKAQQLCRTGNKAVLALHQPSTHDAKAYAAYLTTALGYVTRTLKEVRALHWSSTIAHALRVEASGLKLEQQEVPAIRAGHIALARQLGNRAAALTRPADLVLTRAGLGVCVSSG
jgi:hypothetical protein